jgi:Arc/MetJ-type ribon-helix-helix transcriptional regulator
MSRLNLSPEHQHWMQARISDGTFADENDYVNDLIRRDMATLMAELKKGEESGVSPHSVPDILERVLRRHPQGE